MKVHVPRVRPRSGKCEQCQDFRRDPITICGDCDREYLMIDVRFYRQLREGTFRLRNKVKRLESAAREQS